ncbi:AAA family ATPase [Nocardia sp. BMG51109]|uniref:AAA family ATPase n=1 Tax=Nocardia sp. BMG51109 TaxID=1056816 RepID=UPI0004631755|nr:AAA family ATPase [Nocardia sp. BMG51109]
MSPPLESGLEPAPESRVLTPEAVVDLRGRTVDELRYPATAAVVFNGVPGAGKSTALRRLFGSIDDAVDSVELGGATLVDSQQSRNWWRLRLGRLPYPVWLPIVHLTHYLRIRRALRAAATPVVVHDCGTRRWSHRLIAAWAEQGGRDLHLVMIDVPSDAARDGQRTRGRRVNRLIFARHYGRWRRLVRRVTSGTGPRPVPASAVLVDRTTIAQLQAVTFSS